MHHCTLLSSPPSCWLFPSATQSRCGSDKHPTTTATSSCASNCFSHFCLNIQHHKGQPQDAVEHLCLSSLTARPGTPLCLSIKVRTSSNAFCAPGTEGKDSLSLFKIPFTALWEIHCDILTRHPEFYQQLYGHHWEPKPDHYFWRPTNQDSESYLFLLSPTINSLPLLLGFLQSCSQSALSTPVQI